jgi:IclR family pca regulon transcriptional regulator
VADISRSTGLTRAAARRFLHTLDALGYVRSDGRLFWLTPRVLELGHAYLSQLGLPEVAQPHLQALVERVHESSSVSVLDGEDVVYVARVPTATRIMTVSISVGTRFPAAYTSMGRVLLAGLGDAELAELSLDDHVRSEVAKAARQGWALVDQELEQGLRSVAAPIRGRNKVVAAVNLSTHAGSRTLAEVRDELLPPLLDTAKAIERDLWG